MCHCFAEAVPTVASLESTASAKHWHTVGEQCGLILPQPLILGWPGSNEVSPRNANTGGSLRSTPATPTPIPRPDTALATRLSVVSGDQHSAAKSADDEKGALQIVGLSRAAAAANRDLFEAESLANIGSIRFRFPLAQMLCLRPMCPRTVVGSMPTYDLRPRYGRSALSNSATARSSC